MLAQRRNWVLLAATIVLTLGTAASAGVRMEYDLSPGRVLKYEYRFTEYGGPDLSRLEDSGRSMSFHLMIRFEAEGKVRIEASNLRLVPAPPQGWIADLDFGRLSKVTCTITALMDASGRLENVSESKVDAVVANGEPSALELKGLRSFIWPYFCRSVELALVNYPPSNVALVSLGAVNHAIGVPISRSRTSSFRLSFFRFWMSKTSAR